MTWAEQHIFYLILSVFFYSFNFFNLLLISILLSIFIFILLSIICLSSSFFTMYCVIFTNRKWNRHVSIFYSIFLCYWFYSILYPSISLPFLMTCEICTNICLYFISFFSVVQGPLLWWDIHSIVWYEYIIHIFFLLNRQ